MKNWIVAFLFLGVVSTFAADLNGGLYRSSSTRCDVKVTVSDRSDVFYLQVSGPADARCSYQGVLTKATKVRRNEYRACLSAGCFNVTIVNDTSWTDGRYLFELIED